MEYRPRRRKGRCMPGYGALEDVERNGWPQHRRDEQLGRIRVLSKIGHAGSPRQRGCFTKSDQDAVACRTPKLAKPVIIKSQKAVRKRAGSRSKACDRNRFKDIVSWRKCNAHFPLVTPPLPLPSVV
jgi:hypothetical protein